jgi:hypothetical protein
MQQLILGTGTAIWWLTEPHLFVTVIHFQFHLKHTSLTNYGCNPFYSGGPKQQVNEGIMEKSRLAKTEGNVEVTQIVCWGQKH